MPKIEVIVDGVDVTPKRLLSDEMIALAAKNLGDPNMSNTFMASCRCRFWFPRPKWRGSTTAGGESMSKASISDPNGKLKEMPTVTSKVEEKTSVGSSPVDEEISAQKYLTEAEKKKKLSFCWKKLPL